MLVLLQFNSKKICQAALNGQANSKLGFINAITLSLFLLQLSFACNPALYLKIGKELLSHISFSSKCFCYCRKHPTNHVIRFVRYHLLLDFNSTFMTDSQYFRLDRLKLIFHSLISIFSKYYINYIYLQILHYYILHFVSFSYLHIYLPIFDLIEIILVSFFEK